MGWRYSRPHFKEGWPSGLRHTPGTRAYVKAYRGFESLLFRHFTSANSRTAPMSVGIPFGFKRVCRSNADFRDCRLSQIRSLSAPRLFPTGPLRKRSGFKGDRNYNHIAGLTIDLVCRLSVGRRVELPITVSTLTAIEYCKLIGGPIRKACDSL